jgi:hypothetical protein
MNKEPLICINDSCSIKSDAYLIKKGQIISSYHQGNHIFSDSWNIPLSENHMYRPHAFLFYPKKDFITLSEFRNSQIDKILT